MVKNTVFCWLQLTEEERLKLLYRRECNRQAAQRSRMRKKDLVDNLLEVRIEGKHFLKVKCFLE